MIKADEAIKILKEYLEEQGKVSVDMATSAVVKLEFDYRSKIYQVFFDVKTQSFGFNILTGGVKKYKTLTEFKNMFSAYLFISTVFLPSAEDVVTLFADELGFTSVYQNFTGNATDGYVAIYKVLNTNEKIFVHGKDNLFIAQHAISDEGDLNKVLSEYHYLKTDEGFELQMNMSLYMDSLTKLYSKDEEVAIKRNGYDKFQIKIDDFSYDFRLEITKEGDIRYYISRVNDIEYLDEFELELDDYFDFRSATDVLKARMSNDEVSEQPTEEPTIEDEPLDEEVWSSTEDFTTEVTDEEHVAEEVPAEAEVSDDEKVLTQEACEEEEKTTEEEQKEPENTIMNIEVKETEVKAGTAIGDIEGSAFRVYNLCEDGKLFGLIFDCIKGVYVVSTKGLEPYRIPYSRITGVENLINKNGIRLTELERSRQLFADDVSDDEAKVKELVSMLYR